MAFVGMRRICRCGAGLGGIGLAFVALSPGAGQAPAPPAAAVRADGAPAAPRAAPRAAPGTFVLFVGQSNIAGRTPFLPADFDAAPDVLIFDDAGHWQGVRNVPAPPNDEGGRDQGVNRFSSIRKRWQDQLFSPAYAFAAALSGPHAPGIMVEARSGVSILAFQPDAPPPSDSRFSDNLFAMTVRRARAAIASGARLRAVVWLQGESDAIHFGRGAADSVADMDAYLDRLERFITAFRGAVGAPRVPFVVSGLVSIRRHVPDDRYDYSGIARFNARIGEIARRVPAVRLVSASGTGSLYEQDATNDRCPSDCVHFDHASAVLMGRRYAAAIYGAAPRR